jgi:hypothetical protein
MEFFSDRLVGADTTASVQLNTDTCLKSWRIGARVSVCQSFHLSKLT